MFLFAPLVYATVSEIIWIFTVNDASVVPVVVPLAFQYAIWAIGVGFRVAIPLLARLVTTLICVPVASLPPLPAQGAIVFFLAVPPMVAGVLLVPWTHGILPFATYACALVVTLIFPGLFPFGLFFAPWLFTISMYFMLSYADGSGVVGYLISTTWHRWGFVSIFGAAACGVATLRALRHEELMRVAGLLPHLLTVSGLFMLYCSSYFTLGIPGAILFAVYVVLAIKWRDAIHLVISPMIFTIALFVMLALLRDSNRYMAPFNSTIYEGFAFASIVGSAACIAAFIRLEMPRSSPPLPAGMSASFKALCQTSLIGAATILLYTQSILTLGIPPFVIVCLYLFHSIYSRNGTHLAISPLLFTLAMFAMLIFIRNANFTTEPINVTKWQCFAFASIFGSAAFAAAFIRLAVPWTASPFPANFGHPQSRRVTFGAVIIGGLAFLYTQLTLTLGIPPFACSALFFAWSLYLRHTHAMSAACLLFQLTLFFLLVILKAFDHSLTLINSTALRSWSFASLFGSAALLLAFVRRQWPRASPKESIDSRRGSNVTLAASLVLAFFTGELTYGAWGCFVALLCIIRIVSLRMLAGWLLVAPLLAFAAVVLALARSDGLNAHHIWQIGPCTLVLPLHTRAGRVALQGLCGRVAVLSASLATLPSAECAA